MTKKHGDDLKSELLFITKQSEVKVTNQINKLESKLEKQIKENKDDILEHLSQILAKVGQH